jgi:hypothetical protein
MFRLFRTGIGKVGLAAGTVALGVGAWLVVVPPSAGAAGAAPQPPGLDHFLCYKATASGFKPPTGVLLQNQFNRAGFHPVIGPVTMHCNPTAKFLPTGQVFPINNPDAHLLCFKITATQPSHLVAVQNQFGQAKMTTSSPTSLCLPSWKSLTGPPNRPTPQPPGLDHFTCYPVKLVPGSGQFTPPNPVGVQDQFTPQPVPVTVGPPKLLCLPTQKTLPTGQVFPISNPEAHLLCFKVSPTPIINPVFDQNQFGTGVVNIMKTKFLCLPSFKHLIR